MQETTENRYRFYMFLLLIKEVPYSVLDPEMFGLYKNLPNIIVDSLMILLYS
jgi:hypothetical protein